MDNWMEDVFPPAKPTPTLPGYCILSQLQRAWVNIYIVAKVRMELLAKERVGKNFGILVDTDPLALEYQWWDIRHRRAQLSLTGWPSGCALSSHSLRGTNDDGSLDWQDTTITHTKEWWVNHRIKIRAFRQHLSQLDRPLLRQTVRDFIYNGGWTI